LKKFDDKCKSLTTRFNPSVKQKVEELMKIIKCGECSEEITDSTHICADHEALKTYATSAAQSTKVSGSFNLVSAFSNISARAKEAVEKAATQGKDLLKSKEQRDAEAVERLTQDFKEFVNKAPSESDLSRTRFVSALDSTIDLKFAEIMIGKGEKEKFLTYIDGQILTSSVRNIFKNALEAVPPQIEAACKLSEAVLAPSAKERERLIKSAVGIGGGAAGIGMIIAGIGGALGWGAGIVASVSAFFVGTSLTGPIGWAIAGITLAGIAAYFSTTSNQTTDTERFLNVLKSSTSRGIEAIWPDLETSLMKVFKSESTPQ
jgi:uncharacterized protein YktB (UPF0637 family)